MRQLKVCLFNLFIFNFQSDEEIMKDRGNVFTDTTLIKAEPGKGCPRCGGAVFAAEQMLAKGTLWHKNCYKCKECNQSLNSTNASDGPNNEVFCQGCYGKTFGPVGVGYGHTLSSNAESHIKP